MSCPACGQILEPSATVCFRCGATVTWPTSAEPPVSNPTGSHKNLTPVREEVPVVLIRVGTTLSGRYELLSKLGEGGMGSVYQAKDLQLSREVAVKVIGSSLLNDPEVMERFEREAKLTAGLDHPNIVPVYDVGSHEGRPYIVMKLLPGDSLAGLLRSKGGLTADETISLVKQVGLGLDYIHGKGLLHRDIKAGNIFVSPEGVATILDFGILRPKDDAQGLTRTGMVMGTPHYMAPEQALGLKDVDHRVDLYALAVVLFECLTGTLPFEAESELRVIQMQAHAPPPEILERAPWIPQPVTEVVRRALAKRPEDRYASGAELGKALETAYRAAKAAAPTGGPDPMAHHTALSWRKASREAAQAPAAVAAQPLARASAAAPAHGTADSHNQPVPSTNELARAVRPSRLPRVLLLALVVGLGAGAAWVRPWESRDPVTTVEAVPDAAVALPADAAVLAVTPLGDAGATQVAANDSDAGPDADDDETRRPRVRPPAPRGKGHLNVLTTRGGEPYWAQVSIDGVPRGRTPLLLDLPAGKYQVRIERSGFKPQQREIRVAPGKSVVVRIALAP